MKTLSIIPILLIVLFSGCSEDCQSFEKKYGVNSETVISIEDNNGEMNDKLLSLFGKDFEALKSSMFCRLSEKGWGNTGDASITIKNGDEIFYLTLFHYEDKTIIYDMDEDAYFEIKFGK